MPVTLDEVVHISSRYINNNDVLLGSAETWIFDSQNVGCHSTRHCVDTWKHFLRTISLIGSVNFSDA
jgi:hypothetical protein